MAHPGSAAFGGLLMPGTGHLMLPVSNSILQFFDLQKDEQAQLLQVRHLSYTWDAVSAIRQGGIWQAGLAVAQHAAWGGSGG